VLAVARDRDGLLTAAAALDAGSRRQRAPFTCPGCREPLVARLGRVRVPHFAHRPGSACPLTAPETALHFNAKARLLALCEAAFSGSRRVLLLARCPACRRVAPRSLSALGDAAAAEGAMGAPRADVLVTKGGRPALAIEVLVTHAVEPAREAAVTSAGIALVEVDALEEWERPAAEGAVEVACVRSAGFPPCPACAIAARAEADRALGGEAAQIAELEAYRARGLLLPVPDPEYLGADAPLTATERDGLTGRFSCPDCGSTELEFGGRLARHLCPGQGHRPVAWRSYEGALVELGWWKR
jgi:hypothetical protein